MNKIRLANIGLTGLCFGFGATLILAAGEHWAWAVGFALVGLGFMVFTWWAFSRAFRHIEDSEVQPNTMALSVTMPFDAEITGISLTTEGQVAVEAVPLEPTPILVEPGDTVLITDDGIQIITGSVLQFRGWKDNCGCLEDDSCLCWGGPVSECECWTPEPAPVPHDGECGGGCCGN